MKADIHPEYRFVVVRDISADFEFLTRSCVDPKQFKGTTTFEGEEYPLLQVDISSASHPFYTGTQKIMDTEGRVEAYYRKYGFKNPTAEG
ncbi:MAG: type B 50S ribosomal protein L31 [Myxococcota bacterium]